MRTRKRTGTPPSTQHRQHRLTATGEKILAVTARQRRTKSQKVRCHAGFGRGNRSRFPKSEKNPGYPFSADCIIPKRIPVGKSAQEIACTPVRKILAKY